MNRRIKKNTAFSRLSILWPPLWLVLGLALPALAREEYTRDFDKTVALGAGHRLRVEHKLGDVVIRTQPKPEVAVHATIRCSAQDMAEAKRFADSIGIAMYPSASGLLIETQYPKRESDGFFGLRNISYSVNLEVTVPETTPLEVRHSFGGVTITDLKAGADIATSHGRLSFRNGRGSQTLQNSFAAIEVAGNTGDVTVSTTNGAVDVSEVSGAVNVRDRFARVTISRVKGNVTVDNGNGNIEATGITGSATLNTSYGAVRFADIGGQLAVRGVNSSVKGSKAGDSVSVENSFAPVELSGIRKGIQVVARNSSVTIADAGEDVTIKTSFAPVHGDRIGGAVDVEDQNGSVDISILARRGCKPVTVKTSFSRLRVGVPDNTGFAVTAKTSFGQIHSDFPVLVQGALGGDSLTGKIGNGACTMQLRNQNGAIEIVRTH